MNREEYLELSKNINLRDEENPAYIFNMTESSLLVKIANGEINAQELAKRHLEGRGLDMNGNCVRQNTSKKKRITKETRKKLLDACTDLKKYAQETGEDMSHITLDDLLEVIE